MIPMIRTPLIGLILLGVLGAEAREPDARELLEGKYAEIKDAIATDKTDEGVRAKVVEVLESFTDFEEFGRLTLKRYWKDLKPKQRALFVAKYRLLIHKSYVKHFKANQAFAVGFRGEPEYAKDKARIRTTVTSGKTTTDVDYKLHQVRDTLLAYDIVIDDMSLMRSYRRQFSRIMKRDGFDTLIEKMDRKIAPDAE